jgi:hypothetical protein
MRHNSYALVAAAMAIGLVASACGSSSNSSSTTTATTTSTTSSTSAAPQAAATPTPGGSTDLQSLLPTPANTQRTDGPTSVPDNGIHMHFLVNGSPSDVLDAYKTALEGKGWSVAVVSTGGGGGAGGATYTGTHGEAYGVFGGGGSGSTTDVDACAWPSKPSNPNCGGGNGE